MRTDLLLHAVVRVVNLCTNTALAQLCDDPIKVVGKRISNRNTHNLVWRQPCGERTRVVLEQHAEETLDRAEECTVDHHRTLLRTVRGGVGQVKALRKVEVQLDGRHLPGATDGVACLHRNLRAIESGAGRVRNQLKARLLRHRLENARGTLPDVVVANVFLRVLRGQFEVEVIQTVVLQQRDDELQNAGELFFQLLLSAVDVSIILGKATSTSQTVHHTRLFVAVHRAELEQTQRKFAVGTTTRVEDQVVHRAVHRLGVVVHRLLSHVAVSVNLTVELHRREHAVRVPIQVTRLLEKVTLGHVRGVDEGVAGCHVTLTRVLLHGHTHDATVRVEYRKTRTDLVWEGEQIQLIAKTAVIALLSLLEHGHVLVELFLRLPRRAVDTLQTSIVLVASPVGSGRTGQCECRDVLRRWHVRATAQVMPLHLARAGIDVVVVGQLACTDFSSFVRIWVDVALVVDQFELVRLILEILGCFLHGCVDTADKLLALLDDLLHTPFKRFQIFRRKRLGDIKVVVKAIFNRRANAQLGSRELRLNSLCKYVRTGVADNRATKLSVCRDRSERGGLLRHVGKIFEFALCIQDANDGVVALVWQVQLPHRCTHGGACGDLERCKLDYCFV